MENKLFVKECDGWNDSGAVRLAVLLLMMLSVAGSGCSNRNLTKGRAKSIIESTPLEYFGNFGLSETEVHCGVKSGLFPDFQPGLPAVRATDKGEQLGLLEVLRDPQNPSGVHFLVQMRGNLTFHVDEITGIDESGPRPGLKWLVAKVGIKIANACFPNPLPYLRGGLASNFVGPAAFRFKLYDDGWRVEAVTDADARP